MMIVMAIRCKAKGGEGEGRVRMKVHWAAVEG
jgi:hypothetical protein